MGLGMNLSADTFGGWKNHFLRMERWKQRCLAELKKPYGDGSRDIVDFALSYFVWCHSLREWLVRGKVMDAKVLDENLGRYPQWKICRDIANRCRHYDLTTNSSDKHWSIGREYDPFANPENRLPCEKWFLIFGEEKLELGSVFRTTFDMWTDILSAFNLNPLIDGRSCIKPNMEMLREL